MSVFCKLFNFCLLIDLFTIAFEGEIEAIVVAVQQYSLRESVYNRAAVLSDSKPARQAFANNSHSESQSFGLQTAFEGLFSKFISSGYQHTVTSCATNTWSYLLRKGVLVAQRTTRTLSTLQGSRLLIKSRRGVKRQELNDPLREHHMCSWCPTKSCCRRL